MTEERVQKMARINVDPHAWGELRVRALRSNASLADVLGDLVESAVGNAVEAPIKRPVGRDAPASKAIVTKSASGHVLPDQPTTAEVEDWDRWVPGAP